MKRLRLFLILLSAVIASSTAAHAFSFNLDSIAAMGKFPRFVVNTYRWGDKFFNGYDTTYVQATPYKFLLPENKNIFMRSDPSTSVGVYLTYLAVSAGYDVNLSKLFTGVDRSRQRLRFGFNCMLFAAEAYMIKNDVGTTIKRFGDRHNKLDIPFDGINNTTWGIDAYYFFTHKQYSEAASFNFSRIQKRSHGSFYTGFSIYTQNLDFDFSKLPDELKAQLPTYWPDDHYRVDTHNYAIRVGYGYNWVFAPKWVFGVSESPIIGVRKGYVQSVDEKVSFSMYNRLKLSVVWNSGRWFFGAVGKFDVAIVNDRNTTYAGGVLSGEAVFGFRFNIW